VWGPFSLSGSPVWRLTIAFLWIGAAYFLFQMRAADLGKMEAGKAGSIALVVKCPGSVRRSSYR
jgi:hypothetical protein